jgi:hypothetical protein
MDLSLAVIAAASLVAAGLTLFSGFGLGTILMPVFALFFLLEAAIALTASVHFLNNILKFGMLGKDADRGGDFGVRGFGRITGFWPPRDPPRIFTGRGFVERVFWRAFGASRSASERFFNQVRSFEAKLHCHRRRDRLHR